MSGAMLGLVMCFTLSCWPMATDAFMPNSVFSFRPPITGTTSDPDLDPFDVVGDTFGGDDGFDSAQCGSPLRDGSWTHQDIVRRACLNFVAKFYEETMPQLTPGSVQSLPRLTPSTLLRAVFGPQASSSKFGQAIKEVERAAARMDLFYEVNSTLEQAANIARVHFDDEQFQLGQQYLLQIRRQMFSALQQGSESAARDLAGRFMLSLQDFYSHSNYVELGHNQPLEELGMPGSAKFLETVAGKFDATCSDCTSATETSDCSSSSCRQNAGPSVRDRLLTSGYLFYPTDRVGPGYREKPRGKCSHGDPVDQSRIRPATGGINKSTKDCVKSPHYYLHEQAAQLAIKATEDFLLSIRDVVGDDKFLQFFSLGTTTGGSSLCFVVDQSGSMGDDIVAVRERAKQIVQSSSKPYNYVLVQFNDNDQNPAFGPPIVTQDPDLFLSHLDSLRASGGGDCPELAMHGLQLALINCLPGSPIYVFTDAGPKDHDLSATIFSLIDTRRNQVNFFFTGRLPPCGAAPDLFSTIATRSGGQFLDITKSSVASATSIAQSSSGESQVLVLTASSEESSKTYSFLADCTVTGLTISLSGNNPHAQVLQPNGSEVTGDRVSLANVLLVTISSPAEGNWTVRTSFSQRSHSVIVKAFSTIDFFHDFVTVSGRPGHCGAFPISGQPVAERLSKVVLSISGLEDIASVDGIDLVDAEGDVIETVDLEEGTVHSTHLYGAAFFPPSQEFRFRLRGHDSCGYRFNRFSTTTIKAQTVSFGVKGYTESVVSPGKFTNVTFQLHNSGETNDFVIDVRDDLGTLDSLNVDVFDVVADDLLVDRRRRGSSRLTKTVTLKRNQKARVTVTFGPPEETKIGSVNTATLTASSEDGETFNYVVLQIVVVPELNDETPPTCSILSHTTCDDVLPQSCNESTWNIKARIQDTGVGLQNIKSRQSDVQISHPSFDSGTNRSVDVIATASCCQLSVDIQSSDVVGNVHTCGVDIPPGVEDKGIALETVLVPVTGSTAAGVARISIVNRTALSYSVNVTDMHATALRLSTPEGIVFTVAGFRDGTMLSGHLQIAGRHVPSIYARQATVSVLSEEFSSGEVKGDLIRDASSVIPEFSALLKCVSHGQCESAGYASILLNDAKTMASIFLVAQYQSHGSLTAVFLAPDGSRLVVLGDRRSDGPSRSGSTVVPLSSESPSFFDNLPTGDLAIEPTFSTDVYETPSKSVSDYIRTDDDFGDSTVSTDVHETETPSKSFSDYIRTDDDFVDSTVSTDVYETETPSKSFSDYIRTDDGFVHSSTSTDVYESESPTLGTAKSEFIAIAGPIRLTSSYIRYLQQGDLSITVSVGDITLQGKFSGKCGSCESDSEPVCASDGRTFSTECALRNEVCQNSLNIFMLYKGQCDGNPIEHGRTEFAVSSDNHFCRVVQIPYSQLYPHKDVRAIASVSDNGATVAPVVWTKRATYKELELCVRRQRMERKRHRLHVDWMLYHKAPVGSQTGSVTVRPFAASTVCQRVSVQRFGRVPKVLATVDASAVTGEYDPVTVFAEAVSLSSFQLCVYELRLYSGIHSNVTVNWLAFVGELDGLAGESGTTGNFVSIYSSKFQFATCKWQGFSRVYASQPRVIVTPLFSPTFFCYYRPLITWTENVTRHGFSSCITRLQSVCYPSRSVRVSWLAIAETCPSGWIQLNRQCHKAIEGCHSFNEAGLICTAISAKSRVAVAQNYAHNAFIGKLAHRPWVVVRRSEAFSHWGVGQQAQSDICQFITTKARGHVWQNDDCRNCHSVVCQSGIDECSSGTHNCHPNATCTDTVGGFQCRCNAPAHIGNGTHCNLDHCAANTHDCHANAMCTTTRNFGYNCMCKGPHYVGNGTHCDLDACAVGIHKCHHNAECVNTIGGYSCRCRVGFRGNGYSCSKCPYSVSTVRSQRASNVVKYTTGCFDLWKGFKCSKYRNVYFTRYVTAYRQDWRGCRVARPK